MNLINGADGIGVVEAKVATVATGFPTRSGEFQPLRMINKSGIQEFLPS
jgi:hypothetical protein